MKRTTSKQRNIHEKNIHAVLQQRRLRHISGVYFRNLSLLRREYSSLKDSDDDDSASIYFTISVPANASDDSKKITNNIVYESEYASYMENLCWPSVTIPKSKLSSGNKMTVTLWLKQNKNGCVVFSWNLNLCRLAYVAEHLHVDGLSFSKNALLLSINHSFYSVPQYFGTDNPHGNCPHFDLDEEKASCTIFSLKRMITCHSCIQRTKRRTYEHRTSAENQLRKLALVKERRKEVDELKCRVKRLKILLSRESKFLNVEQKTLVSLQSECRTRNAALGKESLTLVDNKSVQSAIAKQSEAYRERTNSLAIQLKSRQVEVLSQLAYIFPVTVFSPSVTSKNTKEISSSLVKRTAKLTQSPSYCICGIYLPEAENFTSKDDSKTAVALGYTSQLLSMISQFLQIPLRYPVKLGGSQTTILDHITEKLQDRERVFPLYARGNKDRFLFEYAVYLLNKSIAQLRWQVLLPTPDLRPTLHNIKLLLDQGCCPNPTQPRYITYPVAKRLEPKSKSRSPSPHRRENEIGSQTSVNGATTVSNLEKLQDKSIQLNSLRDQLFTGSRKSKQTSPSKRSSEFPRTFTKPEESSTNTTDNNAENSDTGILLTGLEDLDGQGGKDSTKSKLEKNVSAARSELFSTKSGRPVYSKRIYARKSGNYLSTKTELFKSSSKEKVTNYSVPSIVISNGDSSTVSPSKENEESSKENDKFAEDKDKSSVENRMGVSNNNVSKASPLPVQPLVSEDIDLC